LRFTSNFKGSCRAFLLLIAPGIAQLRQLTRRTPDEYLQSDYDIARCSYKLLDSALFLAHKTACRKKIISQLMKV
jgi:hypothetical protein